MTVVLTVLVALVLAAAVGWWLPSVGLRLLWPVMSTRTRRIINYGGAEVPIGLGVVWLFWAVLIAAVSRLVPAIAPLLAASDASASYTLSISNGLAWPLVLGAFTFGFLDDMFGDGSARGFRGHLSEIRSGRLTTGGLKMLGIGLLAAAFAAGAAQGPAWGGSGFVSGLGQFVTWVLATLVIALSANLMNLLDLRPGRALKGYIGLASIAWLVAGIEAIGLMALGTGGVSIGGVLLSIAALIVLALYLLGPVLAVWRYDLAEKGMIGDAGANAMGALAGYLLVTNLPFWGVVVAAVILVFLNVASERVSFSDVIERNSFLSKLDGLGRRGGRQRTAPEGASAPLGDRDRRHGI